MKSVVKSLGKLVLAGFVCGALAFGAASLFASATTFDCPDDGETHLGSCIDNPDCTQKCRAAHPEIPPEEIQGRCIDGCCTCLY